MGVGVLREWRGAPLVLFRELYRVQVFRYRFSTKDIKFSFGLMAAYQGLYGSDSANPYCQIPALRAVGSSKVNWPDIKSWPLALRVCAVSKLRTT
jgi:hypothetical protein